MYSRWRRFRSFSPLKRENALRYVTLIAVIGFLAPASASAYNFLYIHPTSGEPITWERGTTIEYWLDPGDLGRLSNDQAHTLLQEAMKIWEEASPYAQVPTFSFAGYLDQDVTGENYEDYVSLFQCYTEDLESCPSQAQRDLKTVVIFDENGAILDNELCQIGGCAANAGAKVFSGSSADPGNIAQGIAVFGRTAGSDNTPIMTVIGQMVHELGHLLGLAHSSVNQQIYLENSDLQPGETADLERHFATMFFSGLSNNSETNDVTLHPDDIAGISVLYPSDDLAANTATIQGEILKSDLSPMMHVNVIARNMEDPLCEAYSFLSGRQCDVGFNPVCGNFEEFEQSLFILSALPPGSYTLEVEEIADDNLALTLAPGLVDPFISGDAEFWNEGEAAEEENTLSSVITLSAGEIREDMDIILNRSEVTEDRIKYISLDTFEAGPGTRCPEESDIDYAALIGIEEGGTSDSNSDDNETTDSFQGGCSLLR